MKEIYSFRGDANIFGGSYLVILDTAETSFFAVTIPVISHQSPQENAESCLCLTPLPPSPQNPQARCKYYKDLTVL